MSVAARHTGRAVLIGALLLVLAGARAVAADTAAPHATLTAFKSEADLERYLGHLKRQRPPPPPAPPAMAISAAPAAGEAHADNGITNNQESGVDEGDIVKLSGDTLVVLRRGRLFTVSIAKGAMKPIDRIDAYPPGVDARNDWYDEMLIAGDTIVVIGYSYSRGGTEINRFHLAHDGHLKFVDAYQLRSNDYYSSRNYASRLIGHRLVVYTPRYLPYEGGPDLPEALPALRRWTAEGVKGRFERIGSAREVYLSPGLPDDMIQAVHTIVSCDVTAPTLDCKATSVFGPDGRDFYVSGNAVYVWLSPYWGDKGPGKRASSMLYRLPLDGGAPSALGVRGGPTDQFSFREDASDNTLNVLVRAYSAGDAMWTSDYNQGAVALLRVPISAFGDGMNEADRSHYRGLPTPKDNLAFHNRFVSDYVLYGVGNDWGTPADFSATLVAAPVRGGAPTELRLPHGVDRIEIMGRDAVVIGSDAKNVYFSTVALKHAPALGDRYLLEGAAQSETRSHGFFFKPASGDPDNGVLGLPVSRPAAPAYRQLFETSAAIVFLRRTNGRFAPLGELAANPESAADDNCVASCVDWYGNARPIFARDRTFALMGYELVEGGLRRETIRETDRLDFAPRTKATTSR